MQMIFNVNIALQEDGNALWKPQDEELNPEVHQISKTECQITYHEQTLCGSIVPIKIETNHVLYLKDQACLLT